MIYWKYSIPSRIPARNTGPVSLISGNEKLITLQVEDIAYFLFIKQDHLRRHTPKQGVHNPISRDKLMEQLDPDKFFLTNRQTIINIESIVENRGPIFQNKVIVHKAGT